MSTPSSPGWYDDPQDATQLRYFDGVIWTGHTTPRSTRSDTPQQPVPSPWQAPNPQFPGAPQQGQWNAPTYAGLPSGATTPDGQPLAGYGQRVGAFLIDWLAQSILGLLVGGWVLLDSVDAYLAEVSRQMDQLESGGTPDFTALADTLDTGDLLVFTLLSVLVFVVYQVFFLSRFGQTPGKRVTNISVRLRDRPGVPPMGAVARRVGLAVVLFLIEAVPAPSLLGLIGRVLDLLWPAWDGHRQALHDKVAGTNVVVGRPPRD